MFFFLNNSWGWLSLKNHLWLSGYITSILYARWFFVTFSSPSWRSLNHLKGSFNHPKKVTIAELPGGELLKKKKTSIQSHLRGADRILRARFFWGIKNDGAPSWGRKGERQTYCITRGYVFVYIFDIYLIYIYVYVYVYMYDMILHFCIYIFAFLDYTAI